MSKLPLTVMAFGLLLSFAFAQESKTRMDVDVDDTYLADKLKLPKGRVDPGYGVQKDFKRVVASGKDTDLGFYTALYPDCTVHDIPILRVVKQPEHGSVETLETISFPNYTKKSPSYKCNQQKTKGVLLTYKSAQKFLGKDAFDLLVTMPDGFTWGPLHFDLSVRLNAPAAASWQLHRTQ